jgi:hypothetical protein
MSNVNYQAENLVKKRQHYDLMKLESENTNANVEYKLIKEKLFSLRSIGQQLRIYYYDKLLGTKELPKAFYEFYPFTSITWNGQKYIDKTVVIDKKKHNFQVFLEKDYSEGHKKVFVRPIIELGLQTKKNNLIDLIPDFKDFVLEYKQARIILTFKGIIKTGNYKREKIVLENYSYTYYSKSAIVDKTEYVDGWTELKWKEKVEVGTIKHPLSHALLNASRTVIYLGNDLQLVEGLKVYNKIFFIDTNEKNGLTQLFVTNFEKIVERAVNMTKECGCNERKGCVNCTFLYHCKEKNEILDKSLLLESL